MSDQPEPLSAILAEMRKQANDPTIESLGEVIPPVGVWDVLDWADRIEAAYKREHAEWHAETDAAKEDRNRVACRMRREFAEKCRNCTERAPGNAAAMRMTQNDSKSTESLVDVVYEMWQYPETAEYASRVLNAAYRLVEDVKKGVNESFVTAFDDASEKVRQIKEMTMGSNNMAVMREALRACLDFIGRLDRAFNPFMQNLLEDAIAKANAALAAPARNCDLFATELDARQAWKRETHCTGDYRYWLFAPAEGGAHA